MNTADFSKHVVTEKESDYENETAEAVAELIFNIDNLSEAQQELFSPQREFLAAILTKKQGQTPA